jgi:hypothetical protein
LFTDRELLSVFIGKRGDITKSAATFAQRAIAIWAGKRAMQRQFMDLLAITLKEILTEGIDQKMYLHDDS